MTNLIFVFSLPRSGSTYIQKVLGAHPDIATTSEPWLLLPFLSVFSSEEYLSRYSYENLSRGVEDFCDCLPAGRDDYYAHLSEFIQGLYGEIVKQDKARYYLDKTPRYHVFADKIIEIFPDAKFIFLWRNPLNIVSSMVNTWNKGMWGLNAYYIDLYEGAENLVKTYKEHEDISLSVKYEEIIEDPSGSFASICEYLDISYDDDLLTRYREVELSGRLGDPSLGLKYTDLREPRIDSWKLTLNSAVRKRWCANYLREMSCYADVGYDLDGLLAETRALPANYKKTLCDLLYSIYRLVNITDKNYLRYKFKNLTKLKRLYRWS